MTAEKQNWFEKNIIRISIVISTFAIIFLVIGIYSFVSNRTKTVDDATEANKIENININTTVTKIDSQNINIAPDTSKKIEKLDSLNRKTTSDTNTKTTANSTSVPYFTHENSLGDLGDYMGGVAGVVSFIFSVFGLYYVYQTFQQQKTQIADQKKELEEQIGIQKEHNEAIVSAISSITESQKTLADKLAVLTDLTLKKINYQQYTDLLNTWKEITPPTYKSNLKDNEESAISSEEEQILKLKTHSYIVKFWDLCFFVQNNLFQEDKLAIFKQFVPNLSEEQKYIIFQSMILSDNYINAKLASQYDFFKPSDKLAMSSKQRPVHNKETGFSTIKYEIEKISLQNTNNQMEYAQLASKYAPTLFTDKAKS